VPYRLRLRYERPESFREDFERNLAMGGAFVPTPDPLQIRAHVELEVVLDYTDAGVPPVEAQVVHVVPLERALKPLEAGVIVAFVAPVEELRETLGPLLGKTTDESAAVGEPDAAAGGAAGGGPGGALGPDTRFEARVHRIDSESLSVIECSVLELATAGIPMARILEVIPEEEGRIQDALQTLLERGVLAAA